MYSQKDIAGLYIFFNSMAEGQLRRILTDQNMGELHFRVLLKLIKFSTEADFVESFRSETWPQMKLSRAEREILDELWVVAKRRFEEVGLLKISSQKMAS